MDNLSLHQQRIKTREFLLSSCAYIDTIEIFFRTLPGGIRTAIESVHGRRIRIEQCGDRRQGYFWGYRIIVHQPMPQTIRVLDRLQRQYGGKICRLDVAFDFSDHSKEWIEQHLIMRYRRAGPMHDEEYGFYLVSQQDRKRRSSRDIALYADRPSKITGELDCSHVDVRLLRTDAVKREGIEYAGDIFDINPRLFMERQIKLVDFDPEKFKLKIIGATVRDDLEIYEWKKERTPIEKRELVHRRVRSLLERAYQDRVQSVKDAYPAYVARLKSIPLDVLRLPEHLSWGPLNKQGYFRTEGDV